MTENKKVAIVNIITGSRFIGTILLPLIVSMFGPLGTAIYIGSLWLSDAIDGFLARHWEVSTIFGASFDAFCDKVFGVATLAYLYIFYPIVLLPIFTELTIFGVNFHYGKKGANVKSSKLGKFKSGVLDITTVLAILSTISLTSSLAFAIPPLMGITSIIQLVTLSDYISKNKKDLKKQKPKKDVSKMGLIETIKEIFRLLKEPKIYSPKYYKEHKNESLLDTLYYEEKLEENSINDQLDKADKDNNTNNESTERLSIEEQNEFKILYDLNNKELKEIEKYMIDHNISKGQMKEYLDLYITSINNSYRNENKIEQFLEKQEKLKLKNNHK